LFVTGRLHGKYCAVRSLSLIGAGPLPMQSEMENVPGRETALLLLETGIGEESMVAALVHLVGLTSDEAAAALRAARDAAQLTR
jgi:hypothetical protein